MKDVLRALCALQLCEASKRDRFLALIQRGLCALCDKNPPQGIYLNVLVNTKNTKSLLVTAMDNLYLKFFSNTKRTKETESLQGRYYPSTSAKEVAQDPKGRNFYSLMKNPGTLHHDLRTGGVLSIGNGMHHNNARIISSLRD